MSIFNILQDRAALWLRRFGRTALVTALALVVSGCFYNKTVFDYQRNGDVYTVPWWCAGDGVTTDDLTYEQCKDWSWDIDRAINKVYNKYATVGDLPGTAAQVLNPVIAGSDVGVPYVLNATLPALFNSVGPNMILFDGNTPDSKVVGFGWYLASGSTPAGFPGNRDAWQGDGLGNFWLTTWILRGYENHPNVFATSHPCLDTNGAIAHDATSACFTASHIEPLEVVVTNDDGVGSAGIDAVVEALRLEPNVTVTVIAPALNQSGSGNTKSPGSPGSLVHDVTSTASGYDAWGVWQDFNSNGVYDELVDTVSATPADSVLYTIKRQKLTPDLIISGTNKGQNIGQLSGGSGTVGAARRSRGNGVPSIATSTGGQKLIAGPHDFALGATETIKLFRAWRLGQTEHRDTWDTVHGINIPSCSLDGFPIRGVVQAVLTVGGCIPAANNTALNCDPSNGSVVVNDGETDVRAFNNGYVGIANLTAEYPPVCP